MPRCVQSVIGKQEVWRSLDTDSRSIAVRRIHRIAAEVEAEFEKARASLSLTVDPTLLRPFDDPSTEASFADVLAERLKAKLQPSLDPSPQERGKTLGEIYELFCSDPRHGWSKRTEGSYATTRRWVLDVFGAQTPIAAVTREQCREFLNLLLRLPAHADRRYRGLSIRAAVEAAEGKKVRLIGAANINAHLIRFGATMNWALNEGYIERNPARSLQVPDPVARADKRRPFSPQQLRAIFNAPIYTGCEDDWYGYAKPGFARPRRARFWVSLIALFSGMRLNEICQLDTDDIVDVEGVLCFRISASTRSAKRIKSAASERIVPVHPALQSIGFASFLAERRAANDVKLFPELPVSSLGYHSVSFSRWFSRFLEVSGAAADKTCFHSFRHNFRDGLRDARVPREIALLLGGWSSTAGASAIADIYGSGFRPQQLAEELARVTYPLDLAHLYVDPPAAVKQASVPVPRG